MAEAKATTLSWVRKYMQHERKLGDSTPFK